MGLPLVERKARLGKLLADQGRTDEAITVLRAAADASDPSAARRLIDLLVDQGHSDEADTVRGQHWGEPPAAHVLEDPLDFR